MFLLASWDGGLDPIWCCVTAFLRMQMASENSQMGIQNSTSFRSFTWCRANGKPLTQCQCPKTKLVGGFNPFEICSSKWESSPNRGENKKYLKPPPSISFFFSCCIEAYFLRYPWMCTPVILWIDPKICQHNSVEVCASKTLRNQQGPQPNFNLSKLHLP